MKLAGICKYNPNPLVAPRRGAWVETEVTDEMKMDAVSRTPQGCVG